MSGRIMSMLGVYAVHSLAFYQLGHLNFEKLPLVLLINNCKTKPLSFSHSLVTCTYYLVNGSFFNVRAGCLKNLQTLLLWKVGVHLGEQLTWLLQWYLAFWFCWFDSVGTMPRHFPSSQWKEMTYLSWRAPRICR